MSLTKVKLNNFRKLFEQRELDISKSQQIKLEEVSNVELAGDDVDIAQGSLLKAMADKLTLRNRDSLKRINAAMKRIDDGSFGLCQECEEEIPEKRLLAVPDCETCVNCAEAQEKYNKQFRQ